MLDKYISKFNEYGSINISEEVIVNIVINAIKDIDGVAGLANTAGAELAERVGLKTIPKGVKVVCDDDKVTVDAIITVFYGKNVLNVAKNVQDNVAAVIESKTGIENAEVNIHVSGITFEK